MLFFFSTPAHFVAISFTAFAVMAKAPKPTTARVAWPVSLKAVLMLLGLRV